MKNKFLATIMSVTLFAPIIGADGFSSSGVDALSAQPAEKKAQVVLVAGEDNCLGYSYSYHLQDSRAQTVSKEKYQEYKTGYDDVLISYKTMLNPTTPHTKSNGFVPVKLGQGYVSPSNITDGAFGVEVGLAEYLSAYNGNTTTYILKFAGAGTSSLGAEWSANGGYYKAMTAFFEENLRSLEEDGVNFEVSAFCLLQGESDSRYEYASYGRWLSDFSNRIKAEYSSYAPEDGLSFIDAGINEYYINFEKVNAYKRSHANSDSKNYYVDTMGFGLSTQMDNTDRKHYDAISEIRLGQLLARQITAIEKEEISAQRLPVRGKLKKMQRREQVLSVYADGKSATAYWNAYQLNSSVLFVADVVDEYVTAGDGIELFIGKENLGREIVNGAVRYTLSADGTLKCKAYKNGLLTETDSGASSKVDFITSDGQVCGYRLTLEIPFDGQAALSFALVNQNEYRCTRQFNGLKTNANDYGSFLTVTESGVKESRIRNGEYFGATGVLKEAGVWDLSKDTQTQKRVSLYANEADNRLYIKEPLGSQLYFETEISASTVHNGEMWGKFGIRLSTDAGNGIFYYVDAFGGGQNMLGTALGWVDFNAAQFRTYQTIAGKTVGASSAVYQNGQTVKLAVYRQKDKIVLLCNDEIVVTLYNPMPFGNLNSYVGIGTFNISVTLTNYSVLKGNAALEKFNSLI